MSIHLSAHMYQCGTHWTGGHEIGTGIFLGNFKGNSNLVKIRQTMGHLTWRPDYILLSAFISVATAGEIWNLMLRILKKICWEILIWLKSDTLLEEPKYVLMLPVTLNCNKSAVFKWYGIWYDGQGSVILCECITVLCYTYFACLIAHIFSPTSAQLAKYLWE